MSDFNYKVRVAEEAQRAGANGFYGGISFSAGQGSTPSPEDVAALIHHGGCELVNDLPIADGAALYRELVKLGMSAEDAAAITVGE